MGSGLHYDASLYGLGDTSCLTPRFTFDEITTNQSPRKKNEMEYCAPSRPLEDVVDSWDASVPV